MHSYCKCDTADRCFGGIGNIICRLKEDKEGTLQMWARKVFAKDKNKDEDPGNGGKWPGWSFWKQSDEE